MSAFSDYYTDQLTNDLNWRESEMASLRKTLHLSIPHSTQEQTMLRANIALTYAHYEGFCKFALITYVDALSKLKLKRIDLNWQLATNSMSQFANDLRNETNPQIFFTKIVDGFNSQLEGIAVYEKIPQIANLWPDLLIKHMSNLGLDFKHVKNNETLLNSLIQKRNDIAHGKQLTISGRLELDKFYEAATLVMHAVALAINAALENQTYRRYAKVLTILDHAKTI